MTTQRAQNFLFATVDGGGNIAPAMTVVRQLVARGHKVRVLSDLATQAEVAAAGARLVQWKLKKRHDPADVFFSYLGESASAGPAAGPSVAIRSTVLSERSR